MPFIGWAIGKVGESIIGQIDHWVAFLLLALFGWATGILIALVLLTCSILLAQFGIRALVDVAYRGLGMLRSPVYLAGGLIFRQQRKLLQSLPEIAAGSGKVTLKGPVLSEAAENLPPPEGRVRQASAFGGIPAGKAALGSGKVKGVGIADGETQGDVPELG